MLTRSRAAIALIAACLLASILTATPVAAAIPTSCTVVDTGTGFDVSWDQTAADAVIVYRTVDGAGPYWRGRVDEPGLTFSDGPLPSGAVAATYEIKHQVGSTNGSAIPCTPDPSLLPSDILATSDGVGSIELTWSDPTTEASITAIDVVKDGSVVGSVSEGIERFEDAAAGVGGSYSLSVRFADGTTQSVDAVTITPGATGTCRAIVLDGTNTALLWDAPPSPSVLWASEVTVDGYEPLAMMSESAGYALSLDTERDWGAADPDYRVSAYADGSGISSEPCTPTIATPAVIADLIAAGMPVLDDGTIGTDVSSPSSPTRISYGANEANMSSDAATALDLCASGGSLLMQVPQAANYSLYGTLYVPAGVTVTYDVVNHKGNTSTGNWGGRARAHLLNADGSTGPLVESHSILAPFYWSAPGDQYPADDATFFTNSGTEGQTYLIQLLHLVNVSITSADLEPHYRIEDFKFTDSNGNEIGDPCGAAEILDCQAQGGNLLVEKAFTYDGQKIDRGCYDYDGCVGGLIVGLHWLSEWACENDALLEQALLVGTVVVVGGVMIVYGGPIGIGAAIGLATSLWTCDTSDNGALIPAGSIGDVDPGCAAVEIAIGAAAGGLGAWVGATSAAGTTLTRTVAISCTLGAAEGAASTTAVAWVLPDQAVNLTTTEINAALGCVTSGILGGVSSRRVTSATSEFEGGIANVGSWLDQAVPDFDDLPGQGWSAVWDEVENKLFARPSALLDPEDLPEGWVTQYGGHEIVNRDLTLGTSEPAGFRAGFVITDVPGGVTLDWNSGSVNLGQFGDVSVPVELRPDIIAAVEEWLQRPVVNP